MKRKFFDLGVLFLAAYISVHFVHILFVYLAALSIDFKDPIIMFSNLDLDIKEMAKWDRSKIVILYLLPSLLTFGMIPVAWILKINTSSKKVLLHLFYTWIIVISAAFFIAYILVAPFYRRGLGVVAEWFYLSNEVLLAITLFMLPLIPLVAYLFYKPFMKVAHTRSVLKSRWTRFEFLIIYIIAPFLFVAMLIIAMFFASPSYSYSYFVEVEFFRFLILTIILLFIIGFNFNKKFINLEKSNIYHKLDFGLIAFILCVIITLFVTLTIV